MQAPQGLMQAPEGSADLIERIENALDGLHGYDKSGLAVWPILGYSLTPYDTHLVRLMEQGLEAPVVETLNFGNVEISRIVYELNGLMSNMIANPERIATNGLVSLLVFWPSGSFDDVSRGVDTDGLPPALKYMVTQFISGKTPPLAAIQENLPNIPGAVRQELNDLADRITKATGIKVEYFPLETQITSA